MSTDPHELGYVAPSTSDPIVSPRAIELVRQTTVWVRIMSILMFIGTAFMVLGACVIVLVSLAGPRPGPEALLGLFYLVMAALYVAPALYLWRYATHTKAFALYRHEQSLEEALQAQKSFWKFVAILALVMIGLYLLLIPIIIIGAVMRRGVP